MAVSQVGQTSCLPQPESLRIAIAALVE